MITRRTLKSFASMREAYAALLALDADYLKTNRRKSALELTLCSTFTPQYDAQGRPLPERQTIEVRCWYDSPTQDAEYQWFVGRAASLT